MDKAYTERAAGFFRKGELVRAMRGGKVMLCYDILFPRFLYIVEHRSICAFVPSTNHNQILDKEGNICPTFNIPVSAPDDNSYLVCPLPMVLIAKTTLTTQLSTTQCSYV